MDPLNTTPAPLQPPVGPVPALPLTQEGAYAGIPLSAATITQSGLAPYANGVTRIQSLKQVQEQEKAEAVKANNTPLVQNLASEVRKKWVLARTAKMNTVEPRMLQSLRQRRGEYDPDKLEAIREFGGSEIYMMLTSAKCRAAASWLRDVLIGVDGGLPFTASPTPMPDLPPDLKAAVEQDFQMKMQAITQVGLPMTPEMVRDLKDALYDEKMNEAREDANKRVQRMKQKMQDQLVEGNCIAQFSEFIDDICTFPSAIIKGPVVRKKPALEWLPNGDLSIVQKTVFEWERVDPFMIYPSPQSSGPNDGFLIERHRLSRSDLDAMIGVEGYSDKAIRAVLDEYGRGGLHEWIQVDITKAQAEGKHTLGVSQNPDELIDALQYWGSIQGSMLIEWGVSEDEIEDPTRSYDCEVWLIGEWVIKATLNPDPLRRRPYYKSSYEEIPGSFWGNAPPDLIRDCQTMCNNVARAMANNVAIGSGPQVAVNNDRLPPGEDITAVYPWKIWQTMSDPMGSTTPAVNFFQPDIRAQELMAVYDRFSQLADEYSGIPRYMTGTEGTPGAGRTASGLSMMISNAGKSIKQVISQIDIHVISPLVERLYFYNMKYGDDPELKGDVKIIAGGANALMVKEQAQVRRNEFLAATANPIDMQIVGIEGRAAILREAAKTLDMNPDDVVAPTPVIKQRIAVQQQQQQMVAEQQEQGGQPGGQKGPTPSGQHLMNGAPQTDNFQPPQMH